MKPAALHKMPPTISEILQTATRELQATSSTPRLDAEVLIMHACGFDRSGLFTRGHFALTGEQQQRLEALLARRKQGEPIAYLTGMREFWSLEFNVSPATLIPRPETELLVEKALAFIPRDAEWTIADLGTGCGAIALALAKERPRCHLIATDILPAALEVARTNAAKFGLTNIEFREGSWFEPLNDMRLDMIVSNPPYVRANDPHLDHQGDVRFEPEQALAAGPEGLAAIHQIALSAREYLKPAALLIFEHAWDQAAAIDQLLHQLGYRNIVCYPDLGGRDRITACCL
ncbi:MAG: peptide chain release factor N(5)-glutamine methyltransferase [Sulfuricaulis sp.]|uniref:peptide chain release factor N(5)-glutamine methyltransferase n=1 Tax=Sulfuricaulis sp. TaxID=2003553 RepID=UPI003C548F5A